MTLASNHEQRGGINKIMDMYNERNILHSFGVILYIIKELYSEKNTITIQTTDP